MTKVKKPRKAVAIRLAEEEIAMLQFLAKSENMTQSAWLRREIVKRARLSGYTKKNMGSSN